MLVTGFTHGEHYWEIEFLEPPYGTSVMVGVGTQNALLHAGDRQFINLIGENSSQGTRVCVCARTLLGTVGKFILRSNVCCLSLGMDAEGWGLSYKGILWHNGKSKKYTEPFYEINTVIGVLLDCSAGTLTFYRNGENLGLAFSDLNHVRSYVQPKNDGITTLKRMLTWIYLFIFFNSVANTQSADMTAEHFGFYLPEGVL